MSASVQRVTTTPVEPAADTPARGILAGAIAFGGHVLVFLAAFLAGRLVKPSGGGGMEDLAAVVVTLLGGELLLALTCLIAGAVLFRRGWRRTGVGLMGGWLVGMVIVVMLQALTR
jgi:hypothetical protein